MFRLLPITLLLMLSFSGIAGAHGMLAEDSIELNTIAAYNFETMHQDNEGFHVQNLGSDLRFDWFHGYLDKNARLSDQGKFGKALTLINQGSLRASGESKFFLDRFFPLSFSIVAYVKVPPSEHISFTFEALDADGILRNNTILHILPTGDIRVTGFSVDPHEDVAKFEIESENKNVTDNKWHHIVYSCYEDSYHEVYIDGEFVYIGDLETKLAGESMSITIGSSNKAIEDEVFIDDVGFFTIGFNEKEIQRLYNKGITRFLEEHLSVSPQGKIATTWASLRRK